MLSAISLAPPPGLGGGPPPGIPPAPTVNPSSINNNNSTSNQSGGGGGGGVSNNSNLVTIVKAQIVFLLSSINEDNFTSRVGEIRTLSDHHGPETYHHFLRRLILTNAPSLTSPNPPPTPSASGGMVWKLLEVEGRRVARDVLLGPHFATAIDTAGESDIFRNFTFLNFADRINLSPGERLSLGSGIVSASPLSPRLLEQGRQLVRDNLDASIDLLGSSSPPLPFFDPETDISPGMGTLLLTSLLTPQTPTPLISQTQRAGLISALSNKFGPSFIASAITAMPLPIPGLALADFLLELGEVSEPAALRLVMEHWGFIDGEPGLEEKVGELVRSVIGGVVEGQGSVDGHALIQALASFDQGSIRWSHIVQSFDSTGNPLLLLSPLGFPLFLALLLNPPQAPNPPIAGLLSHTWSNPLPQLVLIDRLLSLPSDTFNFSALPSPQRIITREDVADAPLAFVNSTWNCKDIFEVCGKAAASEDAGVREKSKDIIDKGVKAAPEVVFLGMVQASKPWPPAYSETVVRLLDMLYEQYPSHTVVFTRLWQLDQGLVLSYFDRLYQNSEMSINAIVDIAQAVQGLDVLLGSRRVELALDVAAVASKRELINLEQWIELSMNLPGADFVPHALAFFRYKIASELDRQDQDADPRTVALSPQTIATFLRSLSRAHLTEDEVANLSDIRLICLQLHPRLMSLVPGSQQEHGFAVATLPEDVETEVDEIYHKMYDDSDEMPVDEVVGSLVAWRNSQDPRRLQVFASTLYTLFDEYKFFHTYPPRELAVTGKLFGSLILRGLVEHVPLQVAIRFVIDALKSPPESATSNFNFGIIALQAFQTRLPEFPEVCDAILSIPHLHESHPHLIEFVRTTLADRDTELGGSRGQPIVEEVQSPTFKALRLDTFDISEPFDDPDMDTQDAILFIVNNLDTNSFETKTQEMRDAFQLRHSRWFAHYFIQARVAAEPNNHPLYMQFLEALNKGSLEKHILYETFAKIHTLLNSDKTVSQAPDRATLKNLGSWLGRLTLARDKPIKHKNLSLKDLLIEGYDAKRLIVAIPFVCKVLEQCSRSKVFHPPNPWLMAVIRLLVELYQGAELKLNLKFEIEVLCKSLSIDLATITPTTIIRDRPVDEPVSAIPPPPTLTQDLERLSMGPGYGASGGVAGVGTEATQRMSTMQLYQSEAVAAAAQASLNRKVDELISELPHFLVFHADAMPFNTNTTLKRIVHVAVERAIREIVVPVVERSVTIAGISSRDLITKDFATEGNEEKMRKAAHLMVQNLAGNLATVTCKEPLRTSITTNVRALLQQNGFSDTTISAEAVTAVVASNLDLACSVIKKAAQDKAIFDVDETLAVAFNARRRHRERSSQPFWDGTQSAVNVNMLPDLLRIRPNGLQQEQLDVYEEFGNQKRTQSTGPPLVPDMRQQRGGIVDRAVRNISGAHQRVASPASEAAPESAPLPSRAPDGPLQHQQALELLAVILVDIDRYFSQPSSTSFLSLPPNHDLRIAVRQIPLMAEQSITPEPTALAFSQKIVQVLYKSESPLSREVFVIVLHRLCEVFPSVQKEVAQWLIFADDDRKFKVSVAVALIRAGLLHVAEHDVQLGQFILSRENPFRPNVIDFAANLIRECLLQEVPCATRAQMGHSIEALGRAAQSGKATETAIRVLDELVAASQNGHQQQVETEVALRERLAYYFLEWVRMYQMSPSPEQAFVAIVTNLQAQGILKGEEVTFLFFRVCAETAIEGYSKAKAADPVAALVPLDALSKLFVLLLKNYGDPNGAEADESKVRYLNKILSIVVLVLVQSHEQLGHDFDQRPFFRFFSSILNDLHHIEPSIPTAYLGCLRAFSSNTLSMLQPTLLPGFAFSWMSLISHHLFMPKLLGAAEKERNWAEYHTLLVALFKFLSPFLMAPKMQEASRVFFKGAMRILLVLLHDFPEFLAEYHHSLIEAIPPHCIQFRNVILSAFPRNHSLPDPFTYNFVEGDMDKHRVPTILSDYASVLQSRDLRGALEDCVYSDRSIPALVPALRARIAVMGGDGAAPVVKYNLAFLNAVVLYAGAFAVSVTCNSEGLANFEFDPAAPIIKLFELLAADPDHEGQYNLISSIANQLRYPNAHTWFFSHLLIHLFSSASPHPSVEGATANGSSPESSKLPEVITRVLLERVVAARPQPWGVISTFIALLRQPSFWSHEFTKSSPELTTLFKVCGA